MRLLLVLLLALGAGTIPAQAGTPRCVQLVDYLSADFAATNVSNVCQVTLTTSVTKCGSCVGNASCFCGTIDTRGKDLYLPISTSPEPSAVVGHVRVEETMRELQVWTGSTLSRFPASGSPFHGVGGTQTVNNFTYAGEVSACSTADTSCARTVCRCGTCTGTEGSGLCTLRTAGTSPSNADEFGGVAGGKASGNFQYLNMTITAGTVGGTALVGTGTAPNGSHLIVRVYDRFQMASGTTLTMAGRGARGGFPGGTCLVNTAGKVGGFTLVPFTTTVQNAGYCNGGTAGAAGSQSNGGNAVVAFTPQITALPWVGPFIMGVGAGGGLGPLTGTNIAQNPAGVWGFMQFGGCGGGGGGSINGTCTACTVGEAGRGGGNIHIEVGRWDVASGATITVAGDAGGSGSGGGGGGFIHGMYRTLVQSAGTYTVTGGAGGSNCTTVYGAGGAGSAGQAWMHAVPY